MRASLVISFVISIGCGPSGHRDRGGDATGGGEGLPADACVGLQCQVANCGAMGMPPTTISGQVFAPNGTLPLYGINVYVPNTDPGPMPDGVTCSRCTDPLPGEPIVQTQSDEAGKFSLSNVPAGSNIPLVITSGKWRRILKIPQVDACSQHPLTNMADTTLPKSQDDLSPLSVSVDMPRIAISTGGFDALECLIRKLGIADKEIVTDGGTGRVQLFSDVSSAGQGTNAFETGFAGGSGSFADSQTALWDGSNGGVTKLEKYDIVMLSCEGGQYADTKSQAAMNNVKAYADAGGRLFLSHWHNVWIEGAGLGMQTPAVWPGIATWDNGGDSFDTPDTIDEVDNPKGMSFATWMQNVITPMPARDEVDIGANTGKQTCLAVDNTKAERWVYWNLGIIQYPQDFQFTTPNEASVDQRCGKVVFSDMHVSGDSSSAPGGTGYPSLCSTMPLTPQEKALAFMFFDIASCVQNIP